MVVKHNIQQKRLLNSEAFFVGDNWGIGVFGVEKPGTIYVSVHAIMLVRMNKITILVADLPILNSFIKMLKNSILICFLFSVVNVYSQNDPVKFGKVDLADFEMNRYNLDTSAVAIVLCNYGNYNGGFFDEILRIKILKKEGLECATKSFIGSENLIIEGKTYNIEGDEIITTKLKKESVFREKLEDGIQRISFALPNVKVGSIIDIKYMHNGAPRIWYFQRTIPVLWSELRLEPSLTMGLQKNYYGYISLAVNEEDRWIAKNVPAFKLEPNTNSLNNYIAKFQIDVTFRITSSGQKSYTTTWEAVNLLLQQHDYFGNTLQGNMFLNPIAKSISEMSSNKLVQLKYAHEAIKKIHWNNIEDVIALNKDLSFSYKQGFGNSADINLTLVALLNKLDIEAYPAVMSTRGNGMLPFFPTLEKLNYTLCSAKINNENYLLDATEELLPYNLLPLRCINNSCRVLKQNDTESISIVPNGKENKVTSYELSFNEEFSLLGKVSFVYSEYAAFDFRKEYEGFTDNNSYMENLENTYLGSIIDSLSIINQDSIYNPIEGHFNIKIKNPVSKSDNEIYLTPLLYHQLKQNPFKSDVREYPVDYAYKRSEIITMNIALPKGYEVTESPQPMVINLPNKSAFVQYSVSVMPDRVLVMYKLVINKTMFLPNEYPKLKELFSEIIKKHAEPIILKKKE